MSITLKSPRPVSDEDLLEFSRLNPGYQFERDARGELIVTPTGSDAARRELELGRQLSTWARQDASGIAFGASAGFRFPDGWVRAPGASWVRRERWEALSREQREGFAPLCPDAVFEIRSASQTMGELRDKMTAYLANGARVTVLIDPQGRVVEIHRSQQEPQVVANVRTVSLGPDLAGFVLELPPLFED